VRGDRGDSRLQQFARLRTSGVHVVTRLSAQARYVVTAQHHVPIGPTPDGDGLLADATVTLGSSNNRRGTVLPRLRIVSSRHRYQAVHHLLTDRPDLTVTEGVQLDRKRGQIERFCRRLTHQPGGIRPLGQSRAAVWLTLLGAIIVVVLVLLLAAARPRAMSRRRWTQSTATTLLLAIMDGYATALILAIAHGWRNGRLVLRRGRWPAQCGSAPPPRTSPTVIPRDGPYGINSATRDPAAASPGAASPGAALPVSPVLA
jgi:hypothetical protein